MVWAAYGLEFRTASISAISNSAMRRAILSVDIGFRTAPTLNCPCMGSMPSNKSTTILALCPTASRSESRAAVRHVLFRLMPCVPLTGQRSAMPEFLSGHGRSWLVGIPAPASR